SRAFRSSRRSCRPLRGRRSHRAAADLASGRLRFHCHHRRLPRPPEPDRHPFRRAGHGAYLHRWRNRTVPAAPARRGDLGLPGNAALLPARLRSSHPLPHHSNPLRPGMMELGINPVALFAGLVVAATPLLFAAIGELVVEKSGVLNLGVEGMMIMGAVTGFAVGVSTGDPGWGFVAAAGAGAALALVFGILTQFLLSHQVATGLALTLFGLGLAALIGQPYTGIRSPQMPSVFIPWLSDLPVLGRMFFRYDPVVYFGLFLALAVWFFLGRTRAGLILRAVGENHDAAHS